MLVENALDAANLKAHQIDQVLLVGGSTRIPAVKNMLKRMFKKDPLSHVNVDEAVAMGAAIKAGFLMDKKGVSNLTKQAAAVVSRTKLGDVTSKSLGTLAICDVDGVEKLRNTIIISKNTAIPVQQTKTFYTIKPNQIEVDCTVTQGEDLDPEFVNLLCREIMSLPDGRPAGCPIEVTYSYDANGVMKFIFKDVQSGQVTTMNSQDARQAQSHIEEIEEEFEELEIE